MKAYTIRDSTGICELCAVVFAETSRKARLYAYNYSDSIGMFGVEYIQFEAKRFPDADILYEGKNFFDWAEHSEFLIEHGWHEVDV